MPQLPIEIWRRRLESEFEEMKANEYCFTVTKDLREYVVELNAHGFVEERGEVKPKEKHKFKVLLKREFPYPGGIEAVFLTPIFHPNIRSEDGLVCIQLLNEWSETTSVANVVNGLKWLVENPNPASPLNKQAAEYFSRLKQSSSENLVIKKPRVVQT